MKTSTYFNSQGNEITLTHSFIFITNGADDVRKMYEELNELPQSKLVEFPNHPFNVFSAKLSPAVLEFK